VGQIMNILIFPEYSPVPK